MNITLQKNRQPKLEDAAQKRAQAQPVQSIPLQESADADFTAAPPQAPSTGLERPRDYNCIRKLTKELLQ